MLPRLRIAAACLGAAILLATRLDAQPRTAGLTGRIVDQSTGAGVPRAAIVRLPTGPRAVADSQGRFVMTGIPPGFQRFVVQAPGFPMTQLIVELRAGEASEATVALDSTQATAQALGAVTVTAKEEERPSYRLVDFERRRKTGRGQYLDEEQIRRSGGSNLADLTRGMRGVSLTCGGPGGCRIMMVRAPRGCPPNYIVDGREDNMFGATTPIRDIIALEVYTGPSDVPGEYTGWSSGCGVVVIWTRSGPEKREP